MGLAKILILAQHRARPLFFSRSVCPSRLGSLGAENQRNPQLSWQSLPSAINATCTPSQRFHLPSTNSGIGFSSFFPLQGIELLRVLHGSTASVEHHFKTFQIPFSELIFICKGCNESVGGVVVQGPASLQASCSSQQL